MPCVVPVCLRYNLRKKTGTPGSICGDAVCLYFLGPCACCQELRSVPVNDWSLWPIPAGIRVTGPFDFLNVHGGAGGGGGGPTLSTMML